MIFLCIHYCIPLLWFLFYIAGPFFIVFSMFALKRGIQLRRQSLRQNAFFTMFGAVLKIFLVDVHMLSEKVKNVACLGGKFPGLDCSVKSISPHDTMVLSFYGLVLLCISCGLLFHYYRIYLPDRVPKELTPEDVKLKFWVNMTLWAVILMALWGVAPWLGALLAAPLPRIFLTINWKMLATANLFLLIFDFWKLESIVWENKVTDNKSDRKKRQHLQQTWTPKDTLWMTIFLYLLVTGLSYVGNDVLTVKTDDKPEHQFHLRDFTPDVDISNPALKGN